MLFLIERCIGKLRISDRSRLQTRLENCRESCSNGIDQFDFNFQLRDSKAILPFRWPEKIFRRTMACHYFQTSLFRHLWATDNMRVYFHRCLAACGLSMCSYFSWPGVNFKFFDWLVDQFREISKAQPIGGVFRFRTLSGQAFFSCRLARWTRNVSSVRCNIMKLSFKTCLIPYLVKGKAKRLLGLPFMWCVPIGLIWIRISDPRSVWIIKGTDESTLVMLSSVPLMHHDPNRSWITDSDPDNPKGTHPNPNPNPKL